MRILIISAFFPPLNNIASARIAAFEHYMKIAGHQVDVITRYYDPEDLTGSNLLVSSKGVKTLQRPYVVKGNIIYTNFQEDNNRKKVFDLLPPKIKAVYGYLHGDIFHYGWLKMVIHAFEEQLSLNKYDCIIASSGPITSFQAAKYLSKKYDIPWFADYRDLYIDFKLSAIEMFVKRSVQNNLLGDATGLFFVSPGMRDFFHEYYKGRKDSEIVYNGFDEESVKGDYSPSDQAVIDQFRSIKNAHSLTLLHSGSLYKGRNLDFFLPAIKKINEASEQKVAVVLLGLSNNNFDQQLTADCFCLPRVSNATAFFLEKEADALLMPIYHNLYTGFSGKVMEYISSDNIILVEPCKHADLLAFLKDFPNAIQLESETDIINVLAGILSGSIKPVKQEKKELGRSNAVNKMLQFIKAKVNSRYIK